MKKLLLIMLLTFTTFANADEVRYTMVNYEPIERVPFGGVWVLDNDKGKLKNCWRSVFDPTVINCTAWKELDKKD